MEAFKNTITPELLSTQLFMIRFKTLPHDLQQMVMYFAYQSQREAYKEKIRILSPIKDEIFFTRINNYCVRQEDEISYNRYFFNRCIHTDNRAYVPNIVVEDGISYDFGDIHRNEKDTHKYTITFNKMRKGRWFKNFLVLTYDKIEGILEQEQKYLKKFFGPEWDGEELMDETEMTNNHPKLVNLYKTLDYYIRKFMMLSENYKFQDKRFRWVPRQMSEERIINRLCQVYDSYRYNYNICKLGNPHKDKGCFDWNIYDTQKIYSILCKDEGDNYRTGHIRSVVECNDETDNCEESYRFD